MEEATSGVPQAKGYPESAAANCYPCSYDRWGHPKEESIEAQPAKRSDEAGVEPVTIKETQS